MSDRRNAVHGLTRFTANIERIDEEQRLVWGYASTTALASDGKTITLAAMEAALADYMAFANVREMHQLWAAGVTKEATIDDKGMFVCVHVVDDGAWEKVKTGVYKAFSIGAKIISLVGNVIHALAINELSLVDRPSDPEALFTMWRAQPSQEIEHMNTPKPIVFADPGAGGAAVAAATGGEVVQATAPQAVVRAEGEGGATEDPAAQPATTEEPAAVERAEGDPAPEPATPAAVVDPAADPLSDVARAAFAQALSNVENIERARGIEPTLTRVLPGADLRRGFYDFKQLICVLQDLAYLIYEADWDAKMSGDGSPVPDKLREGLKALAEAYKAMSDEELASLLANAGVTDIQRAVAAIGLAGAINAEAALTDEQKADVQRALDAFIKRGFELPVAAAPAASGDGEELTRVKAELATAQGTIGELSTGMVELNRRLEIIANAPLPPKAAASPLARAVTKADDINAPGVERAEGQMSQAEFDAQMAQLSPADRAMVEMRRALAQPQAIAVGSLSPTRSAAAAT